MGEEHMDLREGDAHAEKPRGPGFILRFLTFNFNLISKTRLLFQLFNAASC